MKISIIVPIYNVEKYIHECIDSILQQTFKDYELILVDDGSPDKCGEIIDTISKQDDRIKVVHKPNGGLASARNAGLEKAEGEYICFIDSDDWVEEDYLEKLLQLCEKEEADIAICQYANRTSGDGYISSKSETTTKEVLGGVEAIKYLYTGKAVSMVVAWNKLYKRSIFEGLSYTEGMIHEDEAICPMIIYKATKVVISDDVLYNYRTDNNQSIMGEKYSIKHLDMLKALELRMAFFKEKNLIDYYERDSFKYLYKILLNIVDIKDAKTIEDSKSIIKSLKAKYWNKYKESLGFNWSIKRKIGMCFFGLFPRMYLLRYKK